MREILTIIASAVVAVLAVLAIAPPLINWEDHRPFLDEAISRAAGMEMRSSGRITLRILPEPRLRFDQVTMMQEQREAPLLRANGVKADIALMPLFRGEFRFTDTVVSRAELVLPVVREGAFPFFDRVSPGLGRRWTFDNLHVSQLVLTTQVINTGRTDQILAENVHVQSGAVGGAWRLEGTTSGVPFQLSTGEVDGDGYVRARLRGGSDGGVQFDIDGAFLAAENDISPGRQQASGHVRFLWNLSSPKQDSGQPLVLQADFRTVEQGVVLDPVSIQAGAEGAGPRLEGSGRFDEASLLLALKLGAMRVDADAFFDSIGGRDKISGLLDSLSDPGYFPTIPLDLDLAIDSIGLAGDELAKLSLKGRFDRDKAIIEHLDFIAPGDSNIRLSGDIGLNAPHDIYGHISLRSVAGDRLGRYLEKLGFDIPILRIFDSRKVEASSDIAFAAPIRSLYNLRIAFGDGAASGNLRYTTVPSGRDKLDVQMLVRGLDIAEWPPAASPFASLKSMDWNMLLEGYDIRYGRQAGAGQIGARVHSTDNRIAIETLDIKGLAGANVHVSGEAGADGGLRMTGRIIAEKAAPLVDLLNHFDTGSLTRLFPDFLRRNAVDLEWNTTDSGPEFQGRSRTMLKGAVAGGRVDADVVTDGAKLREISLKLKGSVNRDEKGKSSLPLLLNLRGMKGQAETLSINIEGELAGLHFTTPSPLKIGGEGCMGDGTINLSAENAADVLSSLGMTMPIMPLKAMASLSCSEGVSAIAVKGDMGPSTFDARFHSKALTDWSGDIHLGVLSLPGVLDAMILHPEAPPVGNSPWPNARFLDHAGFPIQGRFLLKADRLNLGNELVSENAVMSLLISPESLAFDEMSGSFFGGKLGGKLRVSRQGGQASLIGEILADDVALADFASSGKMKGRPSGAITLGSSGQNGVAMISNLGGAGELRVNNLTIADTDAEALLRLSSKLLEDDDPLREGYISSLLRKELDRGSFAAEPLRAPVSIVGGVMRFGQITMDGGASLWRGLAAFDLKNMQLDATGNLSARTGPDGWKGPVPQIGLSWSGPLSALKTEIEPTPLANAIAAVILKRETDRIQAMEAAARQRQLRAEQLNSGQTIPMAPSSQP